MQCSTGRADPQKQRERDGEKRVEVPWVGSNERGEGRREDDDDDDNHQRIRSWVRDGSTRPRDPAQDGEKALAAVESLRGVRNSGSRCVPYRQRRFGDFDKTHPPAMTQGMFCCSRGRAGRENPLRQTETKRFGTRALPWGLCATSHILLRTGLARPLRLAKEPTLPLSLLQQRATPSEV
jgi:hypothetical protein